MEAPETVRIKRRVGRPRANGQIPKDDPHETILRAAGVLFAQNGYTATSTRQIAAAAGLRQSAIFHWFASKELIFETLFARGWDRSLDYFERISQIDAPGAVKLCLCLTFDARFIAAAEPYIQVVIIPPELHHPRFEKLLRKRRKLIGFMEDFIKQAIREGDFRQIDAGVAARMLLAIDEVVLDAARTETPATPEQHARMVVDLALHALSLNDARMRALLRQVEKKCKNGSDDKTV